MSSTTQAATVLKRELRKRVRAALSALPAAGVQRESELVSQLVMADARYLAAGTVGLYASMAAEFDTAALVADAFARGKRVFMPRVVSGERREMRMLECLCAAEVRTWERSAWGIREPPAHGRAEAPRSARLDVLIVPGVAFTTAGARCGHGRGFYDTFLARYERSEGARPYTLAPALAVQIVHDVPMCDTDRHVDRVLYVVAPPA